MEDLQKKFEMYLKASDDITCGYCGLRSGDNLKMVFHIDHIWPRVLGGTNSPENLVDACKKCNLRKKDQRGWITLDGRTGVSKHMTKDGHHYLPIDGVTEIIE